MLCLPAIPSSPSRYRPLGLVTADGPPPGSLAALVPEWLSEYGNVRTQKAYAEALTAVAKATRAHTPADLTAAKVARWAESCGLANNSVRSRVNAVRLFLKWCAESEHIASYRDAPYKRIIGSFPPTYGKVQGQRPPVRLSQTEFDALLAACDDGTDVGRRDLLMIWLTMAAGMRIAELIALTIGDATRIRGELAWTGKRNKHRTATIGARLLVVMDRYLATYPNARPCDPLICGAERGRHAHRLIRWGQPMPVDTFRRRLALRCEQAGLPVMAPHDLKRTCARILHDTRSADGGHVFYLVDIADILDHSNAQVTQRCYIGPLGNENKANAASVLG
jgi:integrase